MIIILSPAKSLDLECKIKCPLSSTPHFNNEANILINNLQKLSSSDIANIMKISQNLSELNYKRFQDFYKNKSLQAILAFDGDVYKGLDKNNFDYQDFNYAQNHVRILSGLYGVLKPTDLISPYRLEMGTEFKKINFFIKNLYEFWNHKIENYFNNISENYIINLASNEYFKSINPIKIKKKIINIIFKENKKGEMQIIGINSKKARGLMANFAIKNKITKINDLQHFQLENYEFSNKYSNDENWVFIR